MSTKTKKVRVIAFHPDHAINDVPALPEADAATAVADGWADADPAAVAYAESLRGPAAPAEAPAAS